MPNVTIEMVVVTIEMVVVTIDMGVSVLYRSIVNLQIRPTLVSISFI